jgi:hypothetical protein
MKKLFFCVDLTRDTQNITQAQREEVVEWFNEVSESNLCGYKPFETAETNYIGFFDTTYRSSDTLGARAFTYASDIPLQRDMVSYEFWKENIKNQRYKVVSRDESCNLCIEEVKRNQLVVGFLTDSRINSFGDGELRSARLENRPLYDSNFVTCYQHVGYTVNSIVVDGWMEIDGSDVPSSLRASAVAKGYIFKCQITGYYGTQKRRISIIDESGNTLTANSDRISYVQSRAHELFFRNTEAAINYGYDYCEMTDDWLPKHLAQKKPNAPYHNMVREHGFQWKCSRSTDFTIGFEIEKEDEEMKYKYPYQKLFDETGWIKESDSSLCDEEGYELVSPVFNLMDNSLDKHIEDNESLQELINATYNVRTVTEDDIENEEYSHLGYLEEGERVPSCGGHINIGSRIYTPIQLFFGLKGFLPLLYTVYDVRVDKTYSEAKPISHYLNNERHNDHHSALQIKDSVVELRIVAAVRNVKNLLWRRDLVRIMIKHINKSEQEVLRMMLNPNSLLSKHLKKVYKADEKYMKKCNDFVRFSEKYNQVKLSEIDWDRFKR